MHIPDNYLSIETCAVMTAAMVPVWAHSVKKVKKEITKEKLPMLGVGAAFSFTGMMFNIPLPGGTTGHATGGTLIALLLGPEAACISVTIALLVQALLFGDGGILAFGANCFNMAFVLPYVGYACYKLMMKLLGGKRGSESVAAAVGSYIGINAAALCTAIEFGIQPYLFTDAAGNALYCPYGLDVAIPAMMLGHLTIFGAAEVIFTTAIYAFMRKTSAMGERLPAEEHSKKSNKSVYILLGALMCAVPLGLLATGTAWGEWEVSEIGIKENFSFSALFPDYTVAGLPDAAAYILSAVIGVSCLIILFRLIAALKKTKTDFGES